ncbi:MULTISPECIES: YraN family protein [Brevibacillus]|uniref:UPF0102 protein EDM52_03305 n=1 Tax=Brevibacillus invocatus TaxID=173959 RepID=A0A3M8CL82_9BACL|nr:MULTISPECIES: YraN family protein [Brevibacillus]MCM3078865.1 YraN family protein [Brevibacillus invocatus]MCM3429033.1 YraN family protein [Brevibacillus invocatus]MDH4617167.1 YraN family protein [Brevibacillus sp. AY1]RNB76369.1 YraN family protein [Brevibacillus invocatus]
MRDKRRILGQKGEELAGLFLQEKGYHILDRNVRSRQGEIDIIALDGHTLVFVEVRTRTQPTYGTAGESVTWRKRNKLRELALSYLQSHSHSFPAFRMDVIAIHCPTGDLKDKTTQIQHIEYAF